MPRDGHGATLDKGVLKDFLNDGELVIVPVKDFLVGEPTDNGLVVVLNEEVLVDVPAEDVLEPNSQLDVCVCGLWVVLVGDKAGVLPFFTS